MTTAPPVYTFKASPYSSHALLLRCLPAHGEGRKVLDVGCAAGYLGSLLARRGFDVTGIERPGGYPSPVPDGIRLVEADLDAGVPPLPHPFHYILCADILEHLKSPENVLQELAAMLEPDGEIVASLPNSGNLWFRLNILFGRFPQDDKGLFDRTHLHFYMWRGWRELFARAGLRIVEVRPSAIPVGLMLPRWENTAPVRAAESVFYGMARIWKKLFAYQFVVRARRAA